MSGLEPSFSVPYGLPVHVIRDVWQVNQPRFAAAVWRLEPSRHHGVLVDVDDGLAAARPSLTGDIAFTINGFPCGAPFTGSV